MKKSTLCCCWCHTAGIYSTLKYPGTAEQLQFILLPQRGTVSTQIWPEMWDTNLQTFELESFNVYVLMNRNRTGQPGSTVGLWPDCYDLSPSVQSLRVLPEPAWVHSWCPSFLPQSKAIQVRVIGHSKSSVGVNVNGCLSLYMINWRLVRGLAYPAARPYVSWDLFQPSSDLAKDEGGEWMDGWMDA